MWCRSLPWPLHATACGARRSRRSHHSLGDVLLASEARIEDASLNQGIVGAKLHRARAPGLLALAALTVCDGLLRHLGVERSRVVEEQLIHTDTEDLLAVVEFVVVGVTTITRHTRLRRHRDASIDVVGPADDLDMQVYRGEAEVHDVLLELNVLVNEVLVHSLAQGVVSHRGATASALRREARENRDVAASDLATLHRPHHERFAPHERSSDGDLVRGREAVGEGRGEVAALDADALGLDDPLLALAKEARGSPVEGHHVRIAPKSAVLRSDVRGLDARRSG
mmetsp:Transcript_133479/g.426847  ORF Transcript_133479/g.426847 Transcript_133479/m.426847 type:complete len:283 (+) Transcript_133479:297-1145(+)